MTEDARDRMLAVNTGGAFFGSAAAGRQVIAPDAGAVSVELSASSSGLADPNVALSAVPKAGMKQVARRTTVDSPLAASAS